MAQFGRALRSGHGTIQFASIQLNSHKPFNIATLWRPRKQNTCGQTSFDHMLSHRHGKYKKLNILFRDIAQFGSALRSGRRGRRFKSCYPDQQNLSNQAVSEVFTLFEKTHFFGFDHMLATFYASNAVVARLCKFFNYFLSLNMNKES